jgi:rod shape-determining protein MreD
MKYLFLAVSAFLAIVAQAIAGTNFFLFNFLDLSLILIAYWVIYRSRIQGLFLGTLSGILLDAILGWPLGYNGFGKTVAAFAMGQAAKKFNTEETWIRFVLISVSSCLSSTSIYLLFALLQRTSSVVFLGASFMQALFTAAVGSVVFLLLDTYGPAQVRKTG